MAEKTAETNGAAISVAKPLPDRPKLEARGQNEPFVVGTSAQRTLQKLEPPQMWFELEGTDGEIVRVELLKDDNSAADEVWKKLAKYHAAKRYSSDANEKAQSAYDHSISYGNLLNRLRRTTVKVSDKETDLTENEINDLLDLQSKLFGLRLEDVLRVFPEKE